MYKYEVEYILKVFATLILANAEGGLIASGVNREGESNILKSTL